MKKNLPQSFEMVVGKPPYVVYHYEPMDDPDKSILIFEPNLFNKYEDALVHISALGYLSGRDFFIIPETNIGQLELLSKSDPDD